MQDKISPLYKKVGLGAGFMFFIVIFFSPAPGGLSEAAWNTAAVAALMAAWWITEAIPISATALVPIVLFPILDVLPVGEATAPYANPLIFLFMGGFVLAIAMQKWDLHRRIALTIVKGTGTDPKSIIIGFVLASAFLSMWVSNTATALMMLPIALSVLELVGRKYGDSREHHYFELALLLGIAYACNIGGMGTLIGTPPNALLAGFMDENYGFEISFVRWMMVGIPLVVVALPLMYILLTRVIYPVRLQKLPGGKAFIDGELDKLGKLSKPEQRVAVVFFLTAGLWMTRPLLTGLLPGLSDTGVAVAAALSLFMIPSGAEDHRFVLRWDDLKELPWGVLILFGGGLSLASAISKTGLAEWIGRSVEGLSAWPVLLLVILVVAMIVLLTEITSNTATTAAFLPILGSVAAGVGQDPVLFVIPATLAASCAFMLPVATPPNAIIYGSERINIPEMARAGVWFNLLFIVVISVLAFTLVQWVFV